MWMDVMLQIFTIAVIGFLSGMLGAMFLEWLWRNKK
jgi:hypothetical protein